MGTAALLLLPPPRGGGGGAGRELLLPDGAVRAVVVVFCGASRSQGSRPPTFSLDAAIDVEGGGVAALNGDIFIFFSRFVPITHAHSHHSIYMLKCLLLAFGLAPTIPGLYLVLKKGC